MLITDDYKNKLLGLHQKKFGGKGGKVPKQVRNLIDANNISSVLDFGCGNGLLVETLKTQYPDLNIIGYDPATNPIDLPDSVDVTISSDVLEHIEPDLLDATLDKLFSITKKYQYHLIACYPAKRTFSDGTNIHLIIEEPKWWRNKLSNYLDKWKIKDEQVKEMIKQGKKGPPRVRKVYIVVLERIN